MMKKKKENIDIVKSDKKARTKKLTITMIVTFLLLVLLVFRLFWIEIVQGAEYK